MTIMKKRTLFSFDGIFWNNKLLFTGLGQGALFSYDFCLKKISLFCILPDRIEIVDTILWGNTLYLIPFFKECVYSLDLFTKEITVIYVGGMMMIREEEDTRVNPPVVMDDKVYIFPVHRKRNLMILDMAHKQLIEDALWWEKLQSEFDISENDEMKVTYDGTWLWVIKNRFSEILRISVSDRKSAKFKLNPQDLIYDIFADNDGLWIFLHNSWKMLYMDKNSNCIHIYMTELEEKKDNIYGKIIRYEEMCYVVSCNSLFIGRIDFLSNKIIPLRMPDGINRIEGNSRPLFNKIIIYDERAYLVPLAANYLICLSLKTGDMDAHELLVDKKLIKKIIDKTRVKVFWEQNIPFEDFLEFVKKERENLTDNQEVTSGEKIYHNITDDSFRKEII